MHWKVLATRAVSKPTWKLKFHTAYSWNWKCMNVAKPNSRKIKRWKMCLMLTCYGFLLLPTKLLFWTPQIITLGLQSFKSKVFKWGPLIKIMSIHSWCMLIIWNKSSNNATSFCNFDTALSINYHDGDFTLVIA